MNRWENVPPDVRPRGPFASASRIRPASDIPRAPSGDPPLIVRAMTPADGALLDDIFAGMSVRSRFFRFLGAKTRLTVQERRYLADVGDDRHRAVVAVEPKQGRGIAVARYVREFTDRKLAEIALEVVDGWQGRGVGGMLLAELARTAQRAGIERFTGTVAAGNDPMLALLRRSRALVSPVNADHTVEVMVAVRNVAALDVAGPDGRGWWSPGIGTTGCAAL